MVGPAPSPGRHVSVTAKAVATVLCEPRAAPGSAIVTNGLDYRSQPGPVLRRETGRWIVQEVDQVQQRVLQRHQPLVVG
jgi:hypothetical protein